MEILLGIGRNEWKCALGNALRSVDENIGWNRSGEVAMSLTRPSPQDGFDLIEDVDDLSLEFPEVQRAIDRRA